jgi:hypothetical protein
MVGTGALAISGVIVRIARVPGSIPLGPKRGELGADFPALGSPLSLLSWCLGPYAESYCYSGDNGVAAQIPSHAVLLRSTAVLGLTLTPCLSNIIVND